MTFVPFCSSQNPASYMFLVALRGQIFVRLVKRRHGSAGELARLGPLGTQVCPAREHDRFARLLRADFAPGGTRPRDPLGRSAFRTGARGHRNGPDSAKATRMVIQLWKCEIVRRSQLRPFEAPNRLNRRYCILYGGHLPAPITSQLCLGLYVSCAAFLEAVVLPGLAIRRLCIRVLHSELTRSSADRAPEEEYSRDSETSKRTHETSSPNVYTARP